MIAPYCAVIFFTRIRDSGISMPFSGATGGFTHRHFFARGCLRAVFETALRQPLYYFTEEPHERTHTETTGIRQHPRHAGRPLPHPGGEGPDAGSHPLTDPAQIRSRLAETDEARRLADARSGAPIHSLTGIGGILLSLKQGGILSAGDLETLNGFVKECARLKRFMAGAVDLAPTLQGWSLSLQELTELSESIDRCIIRGEVADQATPVLSKLMKRCGQLEDKIQVRLDALVKNPRLKDSLQDTVISQRNGRYVLALKNAYWRSMPGTARDRSASGSTVFVEPEAVRLLQEELEAVRLEAARERERILAALSAEAAEAQLALEINRDAVIRFDTTLAKGKLSRQMEGRAAAQRSDDRIVIRNGRHPFWAAVPCP